MADGRFITLEGGEGAGKSTQVKRLGQALEASGVEVVVTREPGGAPAAEEIRELLVSGAVARWDAMTETLLHFAARRSHLADVVWPALDRGAWVISDRFADSTRAYQGVGQGLGDDTVKRIYAIVVGDFAPDLTLVLDLPVDIGLARAIGSEDRYERMGMDFHESVRSAFLDIAAAEPARCAVIDAAGDIDAVAADIRAVVGRRFDIEWR